MNNPSNKHHSNQPPRQPSPWTRSGYLSCSIMLRWINRIESRCHFSLIPSLERLYREILSSRYPMAWRETCPERVRKKNHQAWSDCRHTQDSRKLYKIDGKKAPKEFRTMRFLVLLLTVRQCFTIESFLIVDEAPGVWTWKKVFWCHVSRWFRYEKKASIQCIQPVFLFSRRASLKQIFNFD